LGTENYLDFLKIQDEEAQDVSFSKIADKLFNEFVIESNASKYRITEVEFYWNSRNHTDNSTYERKYTRPKLGDWFFHYSGVDIALDTELGHGGILLRSIWDISERKAIKGPLVVMNKIFNGTSAFTGGINARIIKFDTFSNLIVKQSKRIGLGKNAEENNFDKKMYRFVINPV